MSDFLDLGNLSAPAEVSAPQSESSANETLVEASQTDEANTNTEITDNLGIVEEPSSLNKPDGEMTEAEVKALADDPRTPAPLRERLNKGLQYAEKFKTEKAELETQFNELQTKYSAFEGKEVLPPEQIERYKADSERLFELQSFSATPETADKLLKELNPTLHKEYRNQAVWETLYDDGGKPDLDNWQAVIDKGTGWDGSGERILAEDVIAIVDALKSGALPKDDLDLYLGDAEATAHRRQMQTEQQQIKADREFQETQIRTHEIGAIKEDLRNQIVPQIHEKLNTFKLLPLPNEPKVLTEFKQDTLRKVESLIAQSSNEIRSLQEIQKAIDIIGKARGVTAQEAVAEVRGLMNNPAYTRNVESGKSELLGKVDKLLAREAYYNKLLALGLEVENSKAQKAREVISAPNQTANLPILTREQIEAMSADERNRTARERFTAQARSETNRLG